MVILVRIQINFKSIRHLLEQSHESQPKNLQNFYILA